MKMVKRSERGNTMVEFALAFMVFFLVLYGIMEFGRVVASYNILSGAAREGARYAIVHGSSSGSAASSTDIQTIVRNWSVGLESSSVAVTTTWTPGNAPGNTVKVKASYAISPFSGLIFRNNITLQSTSQMVISQ
jgi:Flp pilus assembly protein TadG